MRGARRRYRRARIESLAWKMVNALSRHCVVGRLQSPSAISPSSVAVARERARLSHRAMPERLRVVGNDDRTVRFFSSTNGRGYCAFHSHSSDGGFPFSDQRRYVVSRPAKADFQHVELGQVCDLRKFSDTPQQLFGLNDGRQISKLNENVMDIMQYKILS